MLLFMYRTTVPVFVALVAPGLQLCPTSFQYGTTDCETHPHAMFSQSQIGMAGRGH